MVGTVAPDFPSGLRWLNSSAPLSLRRDLRQKAVLIEFWTYSCVNCLRGLPYLKRWHEKYQKLGLAVIGIHTPEFSFEKEEKNVKEALRRFGITFPVVLDNDYKIWNQYANAWWPRKLLINTKGEVVFDHIGEGGYMETETMIRGILRKELRWPEDALPPAETTKEGETGGICYQSTPEIYLGYGRGQVGTNDLLRDRVMQYHSPARTEFNQWYLEGVWEARKEFIEHLKDAGGDFLEVRFSAFSVNCVMESAEEAELHLVLNGGPIKQDKIGRDVELLPDGTSVVCVKEPRMYNLISSPQFIEGDLKILVNKSGVKFYAFTFGGCEPRVLPEAIWQK